MEGFSSTVIHWQKRKHVLSFILTQHSNSYHAVLRVTVHRQHRKNRADNRTSTRQSKPLLLSLMIKVATLERRPSDGRSVMTTKTARSNRSVTEGEILLRTCLWKRSSKKSILANRIKSRTPIFQYFDLDRPSVQSSEGINGSELVLCVRSALNRTRTFIDSFIPKIGFTLHTFYFCKVRASTF